MTEPAPVTFRDFAAAVMGGDVDRAATVLETLLRLSPDAASAAANHFRQQMATAGQPFMMKAMGLRQAVTGGTDAEVDALLAECFGLAPDAASSARAAVRETAR